MKPASTRPAKRRSSRRNAGSRKWTSIIQVHQLRQFLQTSSLVNQEGLVNLLQHFLAKTTKTDAIRDKIDFLLVQYFSQLAPAGRE